MRLNFSTGSCAGSMILKLLTCCSSCRSNSWRAVRAVLWLVVPSGIGHSLRWVGIEPRHQKPRQAAGRDIVALHKRFARDLRGDGTAAIERLADCAVLRF